MSMRLEGRGINCVRVRSSKAVGWHRHWTELGRLPPSSHAACDCLASRTCEGSRDQVQSHHISQPVPGCARVGPRGPSAIAQEALVGMLWTRFDPPKCNQPGGLATLEHRPGEPVPRKSAGHREEQNGFFVGAVLSPMRVNTRSGFSRERSSTLTSVSYRLGNPSRAGAVVLVSIDSKARAGIGLPNK